MNGTPTRRNGKTSKLATVKTAFKDHGFNTHSQTTTSFKVEPTLPTLPAKQVIETAGEICDEHNATLEINKDHFKITV